MTIKKILGRVWTLCWIIILVLIGGCQVVVQPETACLYAGDTLRIEVDVEGSGTTTLEFVCRNGEWLDTLVFFDGI